MANHVFRPGKVYFIATDNNTPSGGRMFIYLFTEMLCDMGIDAYALHSSPGFSYSWFDHTVKTHYSRRFRKKGRVTFWEDLKYFARTPSIRTNNSEIDVDKQDIIVVPENRLFHVEEIFPECKKIIFCQGSFLLINQLGYMPINIMRKKASMVIGAIGTSDLCCKSLELIFERIPIFHVPLFLDNNIFHYTHNKKRQIAYMPRKMSSDAKTLINLLQGDNMIGDFQFLAIDGQPIDEVARILRESLIFLSFADLEGFGLPAAEAMACGCIVAGYTGYGGDEFFDEGTGFPIQQGNIFKYHTALIRITSEYETDPRELDALRRRASDAISSKYQKQATVEALSNAWRTMFGDR